MTPEDRLRAAITARTSSIEPGPDGLHHLEEKLMDVQRATNRNRLLLGVAAAAAVVAAVVGTLALAGDGDEQIDTADSTTSTPSTSAPSTTEATTTTVFAPTVDPTLPVFPDPGTARRFDDPSALTYAFAHDLLGFRDPIVGQLAQGDSRSGEVEVRAFAQGNPTTVLVRQLDDDSWFVIGASAESIRLGTPEPGATIASPQPLEGEAFAFEGHVAVRLLVDGVAEPIAQTFVTGRGDQMGPFSGELAFDLPAGVRHGVLVLVEPSAEDGSAIAATVIRVHF